MNIPFETFGLIGAGGLVGALLVYGLMAARTRELATRLELSEKDSAEKITLLEQARLQMADTFKVISSEALKNNNQQFLTLAQENLAKFHQQADTSLEAREKAIQALVQPVSDSLQKMDTKIADLEQKRAGAYAEMMALVNVMKDQHQHLQTQTSSLVQTLRAPTSRGQWGEMQLKRVLDFSGLVEGVHYTRQATAEGMRPDVIIQMPPEKVLLLDAKVPMQNYLSAMQPDLSDDEKNAFLIKHANDLKGHIKTLSDKDYSRGFNSFNWVIMFLPLDGLIQMALDKQPDIIEFAWSKNVVIATPTNLLALMRTVAYAHDQFKISENAKEISSLAETMYQRVIIFGEHFAKMGRGLSTAIDSYNQGLGSLERNVLSSLRKMKETGIKADDRNLELKAIEEAPRVLTASEFLKDN